MLRQHVQFLNLFIIGLATLFSSAVFAESKGLTLFLSTSHANRYGGQIMLDAGELKIDEIPDFMATLDPQTSGAVLPASNAPVEVSVVVPKNAPLSYRQEFLGEVSAAIQTRYPQAKFKLVESFVDLEADAAALLETQADIKARQSQPGLSARDAKILEAAQTEVTEGLKDDQALCESWFRNSCPTYFKHFNRAWSAVRHPYNTVIAARAVALTKFGVSVSVTISKYGLNPVSALIAVAQGGIAATFGYNAKSWSEWCTSHQFPFFKESLPVSWYNRTGWFKSATINFFRSLGLSYVFRTIAHESGQTVNGRTVETANSFEFLFQGLGLTIPEIVLDGLMDDGARALELRGRINDQGRKYLLWGISMIDTVMHTAFRAGAINVAYSAAAVSWGTKLGVWGAGKLLKQRAARFIAISSELNQTTSGRAVSAKNFIGYLFGAGIPDAIMNRVRNQFTVTDRTMVEQDLGIDETWKLSLSESDLARLRTDRNLSEADLRKILNLKDSEPDLVKAMMSYRSARLMAKDETFTAAELCNAALTGVK